jgi:hypothetical protein
MKRWFGLWLLGIGGCALTPPIPGGPLRPGTYTAAQVAWAYAYGPARASERGQQISGNGQMTGRGEPIGSVVPVVIGIRQALAKHVELAADYGFLNSGVELRAGTGAEESRWPAAISLQARSSRLAIGVSDNNPGPTYEVRLRFEVYPEVVSAEKHLMLSLGVSHGVFEHSIAGPEEQGGDVPDLEARFVAARPETRLEFGVGFDLQVRHAELRFAALPWVVLGSGGVTAPCLPGCGPIDFSQAWGLSILFSPSLGGDVFAHIFAQ